jgi:hypothetical protein
MPDYSKGQIYTIRFHNDTSLIYIGSTIQPLYKRFYTHKHADSISLYKLIKNEYNNDWSICYIELYELFPCNSRQELEKKEGEIMRIFMNDSNYKVINKNIAGRTYNEYRDENKDKLNELCRIWGENNKDYIKDYNNQYYQNNKEQLIDKSKTYREENKEKVLKNKQKYYEENKEKIKERESKKFNCECGGCYTRNNKLIHLKTKKHQKYLDCQ